MSRGLVRWEVEAGTLTRRLLRLELPLLHPRVLLLRERLLRRASIAIVLHWLTIGFHVVSLWILAILYHILLS